MTYQRARFLNFFGLAFWVEIVTKEPRCTYYFGPFIDEEEANGYVSGYLEDLETEQAQGITFNIKRCKPKQLTVFIEDELVKELTPSGIQ
jgi:hypothetical protein